MVARLAAAGCIAADAEADAFLHAAPDAETLQVWIARRERGEPPAWITGTTSFCGRSLHVVPGVYVPRAQTEELAHRAAALLPSGGRALDLCTGTGAIAAHLGATVPTATVIALDLDPRAAACARRNGVMAVAADLAEPLRAAGAFDVITAVAPYVPTGAIELLPSDVQRYEPRAALDGGVDGLAVVRRILDSARTLLRPDGWLLLEVGGDQLEALAHDGLRTDAGLIDAWADEDGDLRGIVVPRSALGA